MSVVLMVAIQYGHTIAHVLSASTKAQRPSHEDAKPPQPQ